MPAPARRGTPLGAGLLVFVLPVWMARDAAAHIDLRQPPPREQGLSRAPNANLKEGPCGQVVNGRTDEVSVFSPGETIEVSWAETTNHRSYYRIAFDRDGDDDFPTFPGPGIGAEGIDPAAPCPVDGEVILAYDMDDRGGGTHTHRVQLPRVECERCTLQVVQYMFDTNTPYYFQCADLALRSPGAEDAGARAAADPPNADAGVRVSAAPGCHERITPLDAGRRGSGRGGADDDEVDEDEAAAPMPSAPASARPRVDGPAPVMAASERRSNGGCALTRGDAEPAALGVALIALCGWWRRARRRAR